MKSQIQTKVKQQKFASQITIGDRAITLTDIVSVARLKAKVSVDPDIQKRLEPSLLWIEGVVKSGNPVVYGLNTGVGGKSFSRLENGTFQTEILHTHATGVGEPLHEEIVRATMFLMANSLAKGYSGIRPIVVGTLVSMLNKGVIPVVPSKGSVGSCGDLIPLSHIAMVLSKASNEKMCGRAFYNGKEMSGIAVMKLAGIPQITLEGIEGLTLINAPWVSAAIATLAVYDALNLLHHANLSASMSMEALRSFLSPFYEGIQKVKHHHGQKEVSKEVLANLENSNMVYSIEKVQSVEDPIAEFGKIHDAYSIRCIPQVHGAVGDSLSFIDQIIEKEINSVSDNPVIFPYESWKNKAVSGGNPHGEHIAMAMDFLSISLTELGNICERRIYRLVNGNLNEGLPSGLCLIGERVGLEILHYTAASLVSENKTLSHPASVDSIPMAEDMEDYVSMATNASAKTKKVIENLKTIIAIELISAVRGIYLRKLKDNSLQLGKRTNLAYETISERTAILKPNPILSEEIKKVVELIDSETIFKNEL